MTLISSVCPLQPHFGRQTPTMAAVGTPGWLDALLNAEGVTVHARTYRRLFARCGRVVNRSGLPARLHLLVSTATIRGT
jgi:hypothetical protein